MSLLSAARVASPSAAAPCALGERRALSVRDRLVELGVGADRIRTMSLGEDRPADPGFSEDAYQANRRGEFVLLKPKS